MDNSERSVQVTGLGTKPVSLKSVQEHLQQRVDILTQVCEALVMESVPVQRARLMAMLAVISNLDVDPESRDV